MLDSAIGRRPYTQYRLVYFIVLLDERTEKSDKQSHYTSHHIMPTHTKKINYRTNERSFYAYIQIVIIIMSSFLLCSWRARRIHCTRHICCYNVKTAVQSIRLINNLNSTKSKKNDKRKSGEWQKYCMYKWFFTRRICNFFMCVPCAPRCESSLYSLTHTRNYTANVWSLFVR